MKAIHEGWTAKKDGQDYRDAMRLVQDDYHRDVSAWVGLTRIGPGRKRLERDEYMAMKADAEQTRTMLRDIEAQSNKANDTLQKPAGQGWKPSKWARRCYRKRSSGPRPSRPRRKRKRRRTRTKRDGCMKKSSVSKIGLISSK